MNEPVVAAVGDAIHASYRMTSSDFWKASLQSSWSSTGSVALGTYLVGLSLLPVSTGDLVGLVTLILGLAIATGLYCIPFALLAVRRRSDLFLSQQDLAVDGWGVRFSTVLASSQQAWPTFRRVRDLPDAFVLEYGTGAGMVIPKHVLDDASIDRFRSFAAGAGKLVVGSRRDSVVKGLIIGALAAVAFVAIVSILVDAAL